MSGITLAQAQAQLNAYIEAETSVLANQSYEIAGRKLTRADLQFIQQGIDAWNRRVIDLAGKASGRRRARTIVVGG